MSKIGKQFELIIQNSKYSQRAVICCPITPKSQTSRLPSWTESCFLTENSSAQHSNIFLVEYLSFFSNYSCYYFVTLFVFVLWPVLFWVLVKASCHFPCPSPWFDIFCQLLCPKAFFPLFLHAMGSYLHKTFAFIAHGRVIFIPEKFFTHQGGKDQKERCQSDLLADFLVLLWKNSTAQSKCVHSEDYFILIMKIFLWTVASLEPNCGIIGDL